MTKVNSSSPGYLGAGWLYKLMVLIQGLSIIFLAIVAIWLIVSFPVWWSSAPRISLPINVELHPSAISISTTAENTTVLDFSTGRSFSGALNTKFSNPWAQWIYILIIGLQNTIAFFIIQKLRQIVGSIAEGLAFSHQNANRLQILGILFFCMAIFDSVVVAGFSFWAAGNFTSPGGGLNATNFLSVVDMKTFVIIWIIFVFSEVFRQGAKISKEQSLTI